MSLVLNEIQTICGYGTGQVEAGERLIPNAGRAVFSCLWGRFSFWKELRRQSVGPDLMEFEGEIMGLLITKIDFM
jgi:hypothetical protein